MGFLFDKSVKPKSIVPDWLIPDNWDEGKVLEKHSSVDISPNTIKGVFSPEYENVIRWTVTTLINTGYPWRVTTEILEPPSDKVLFLVHIPNKQEKPAFFNALKFYLEQVYVSKN